MTRTNFVVNIHVGILLCCVTAIQSDAAPPTADPKQLTEPVYRVAKNVDEKAVPDKDVAGKEKPHPIDVCLEIAHKCLEHSRKNVDGYTAIVRKRETIGDTLTEAEMMFIKVRNRKEQDGELVTPLSLYLNYLKPVSKKGQEAIWVEGQNGGKLIAHGTGIQGLIKVNLDPNGTIAKMGTNYAIFDLGIENLILKLIDRANGEKANDDVEVHFYKNAKINGRVCTLMEVKHPVQRAGLDFHIARIFIDDELNLPVLYQAYNWPKVKDGELVLIEEFIYTNVNLDVKLTDKDFDPANPEYHYP